MSFLLQVLRGLKINAATLILIMRIRVGSRKILAHNIRSL
jgi:hypothetical protein